MLQKDKASHNMRTFEINSILFTVNLKVVIFKPDQIWFNIGWHVRLAILLHM